MRIDEDSCDAVYRINAYTANQISVNNVNYQRSIIISASHLILDWPPQAPSELRPEHWQVILTLKPELVLVGLGSSSEFPPTALLAPFYQHHTPVECMSTAAACRTYTALIAEGRGVVAALLLR